MRALVLLALLLSTVKAEAQPAAEAATLKPKPPVVADAKPDAVKDVEEQAKEEKAPKQEKKQAPPVEAVVDAQKAAEKAEALARKAAQIEEMLKTTSGSIKSMKVLLRPIGVKDER